MIGRGGVLVARPWSEAVGTRSYQERENQPHQLPQSRDQYQQEECSVLVLVLETLPSECRCWPEHGDRESQVVRSSRWRHVEGDDGGCDRHQDCSAPVLPNGDPPAISEPDLLFGQLRPVDPTAVGAIIQMNTVALVLGHGLFHRLPVRFRRLLSHARDSSTRFPDRYQQAGSTHDITAHMSLRT